MLNIRKEHLKKRKRLNLFQKKRNTFVARKKEGDI